MTSQSRPLRDRTRVLGHPGVWAVEVLRAVRRVARENLPFLLVSVAYFAAARVVQTIFGAPVAEPSLRYPGSLAIYSYLLLVAAGTFWAGLWQVPHAQRPKAALDRAAMLGLVLIVIPFMLNTYGDWKLAIPVLRPFVWDARLAALDRAIHFGHDPWRLLQPLVGYPSVTWWLDYAYLLWFPVTSFALIWQWCSGHRLDRARYLLAYVLVHVILGTAAALGFSSAGPCYYRFVAGSGATDPYAGLFAYLERVNTATPLLALQGQAALWRNYATMRGADFLGISAMPSVHLAVATLVALAAWRTKRAAGWVFAGFAGITLIGSVHLGWHYAVDGYAAIAGAGIIWWASGLFLRRYFEAAGISAED